VTIYEVRFDRDPTGVVFWSFVEPSREVRLEVRSATDRLTCPAGLPAVRPVTLPPGARLVQRSRSGVVVEWERDGRRVQSDAAEVYALARLGMCEFATTDRTQLPPSGGHGR